MLRQASATRHVCNVWKAMPSASSGTETDVSVSHSCWSQSPIGDASRTLGTALRFELRPMMDAESSPGAVHADAGHREAVQRHRSRWRRILAAVAGLAVITGVFVGLLPRIADYGDIWAVLQTLTPGE